MRVSAWSGNTLAEGRIDLRWRKTCGSVSYSLKLSPLTSQWAHFVGIRCVEHRGCFFEVHAQQRVELRPEFKVTSHKVGSNETTPKNCQNSDFAVDEGLPHPLSTKFSQTCQIRFSVRQFGQHMKPSLTLGWGRDRQAKGTALQAAEKLNAEGTGG
jgi:hypothetical protein